MKTVPPEPVLNTKPISREHSPSASTAKRAYESFRPCLRWDFGFTCPSCLRHETDLHPRGAAGRGSVSIEHLAARTQRRNNYATCVLCCGRCNSSRQELPALDANGVRLLDPCADVWADHFELVNDEVKGTTPEGKRTELAYRIDFKTKVEDREYRRTTLTQALSSLPKLVKMRSELQRELESGGQDDRDKVRRWLRQVEDSIDALFGVPRARPTTSPTEMCSEPGHR